MRRTHLIAVALACWSSVAVAQDAGALFDRGVDAMEAGKFAEACPMLAESYKLDPRPGTLFTLAECESRQGKLASAVARYDEYLKQTSALPPAQRTKHAERQQKATEALKKLEPQIARVTFEGASADDEVLLDGQKLGPERLAGPVPVDPGPHTVVVRRGGSERSSTFSAQAGGSQRVSLEDPAKAAPTATASTTAPPPEPPPPSRTPWLSTSMPFYIAAGVGAAGLLIGTIGGAVALSKKGTADDQCPGLVCTAAGMDAVDSGRSAATVGTVGFVVGGLFLGAAGALWATGTSSPSHPSAMRLAPTVGRSSAGLLLGGGFLWRAPSWASSP